MQCYRSMDACWSNTRRLHPGFYHWWILYCRSASCLSAWLVCLHVRLHFIMQMLKAVISRALFLNPRIWMPPIPWSGTRESCWDCRVAVFGQSQVTHRFSAWKTDPKPVLVGFWYQCTAVDADCSRCCTVDVAVLVLVKVRLCGWTCWRWNVQRTPELRSKTVTQNLLRVFFATPHLHPTARAAAAPASLKTIIIIIIIISSSSSSKESSEARWRRYHCIEVMQESWMWLRVWHSSLTDEQSCWSAFMCRMHSDLCTMVRTTHT